MTTEKVDDYEARFRCAYDNENWQEAVAVWGECGRNDKDLTVKLHERIRNELLELLLFTRLFLLALRQLAFLV